MKLLNRMLFMLALLFPIGCLACDIPKGTYKAITESEYSLTLELLDQDRYRFTHSNWLSGMHHVGEEHTYKGEYRCEGNQITLEYTDNAKPVVGYYRTRSLKEDGFPMDGNTVVLDFLSDQNKGSKISGWVYWPNEFVMKTFGQSAPN